MLYIGTIGLVYPIFQVHPLVQDSDDFNIPVFQNTVKDNMFVTPVSKQILSNVTVGLSEQERIGRHLPAGGNK